MPKRKSTFFEDLEQSLTDAVAFAKGAPKAGTRTIVLKAARPRSAAQIKRLRISLRLTQAGFASLMSVSIKTVEAWESGTRTCKGPALRLFEILESHPDMSLLGGLAS